MTASGPRTAAWMKWLLKARPVDYMLALSDMGASLPVVGRHLEPIGTAAAMSAWGARHVPDFVSASARGLLKPGNGAERRSDRDATHAVSVEALREVLPAADLDGEWPAAGNTPPAWDAMWQKQYLHRRGVHYGDHPTQLLDVWRRKDLPPGPAPVLIFVPGGAWVFGSPTLQGTALMSRLAELGWVCLAINYRVSPHNRWPRHISDVKAAVAWARANVDKFGGDRDFVAVAGCSAGGHLAALTGLTPGDPAFESGLPAGSDTSVDAVVGIYGRYDWADRSTPERERFLEFLQQVVVKRSVDRHPDVFRDASPTARVHRNAPPFFLIHGSNDSVIPVWQARDFVEKLRAVSDSAVGYLELPGAGHAFDMIDGPRAGAMAHATALFLNHVHRTRRQFAKEVI